MSEKNEIQVMLDELKAMKESMAAASAQPQPQAQPQAGVFSAWQQAAPQVPANVGVEKVLVHCEVGIRTPQKSGNVNIYLQFPGSVAESPQALLSFIEGLVNANLPVKVWPQKDAANPYKR